MGCGAGVCKSVSLGGAAEAAPAAVEVLQQLLSAVQLPQLCAVYCCKLQPVTAVEVALQLF